MNPIKKTKPSDFPEIYGYADDFFTSVVPKLENLLDRRARRLNLSQTFGSAFHSFHPFLLDFRNIRKLLASTKRTEKDSCTEFWKQLNEVSVIRQFKSAESDLKQTHTAAIAGPGEILNPNISCEIQMSAYDSLEKWAPEHMCKPIFRSAFPENETNDRAQQISTMQNFCTKLEAKHGFNDNEFVDLYNMVVYKNSLAYHCYNRITDVLNAAYEHALGLMTIRVPHENYVFGMWKDVACWFGFYKAISAKAELVMGNIEMNHFFVTIFCLRDWELGVNSLAIKRKLLEVYLTHPKNAKHELTVLLKKYPFAAPFWIKQYLKL